MRKILLALCCLPLLMASCKKDDKNKETISGLVLRKVTAEPVMTIGTPDVNDSTNDFEMMIYPTPSYDLMNVYFTINNAAPVTITARLVHARYPDAPAQVDLTPMGFGVVNVKKENESLAGTVAASNTINLPAASQDTSGNGGNNPGNPYKGQPVQFSVDVSALPVGFYRLYIETSDGKKYWDNTWISR